MENQTAKKIGYVSIEIIMVAFTVFSVGFGAVGALAINNQPQIIYAMDHVWWLMGFNPYPPVFADGSQIEYDEMGYAKKLKINPSMVNPTSDFTLVYDAATDSYMVSHYNPIINNLNIVIPRAASDGKLITKIGPEAFMNRGLTSVAIPDTITEIADKAFYMNQLAHAVIPRSVKKIGNEAFYNNKLKTIDIDQGVTHMGHRAFKDNDLTQVSFDGKVPETLGDDIFIDNNNDVLCDGAVWVPQGQVDNYKSQAKKFKVCEDVIVEKPKPNK